MHVPPSLAAQVLRGSDGRMYEVSGEAGRIVKMLAALDPPLDVIFVEGPMMFAISQRVGDEKKLVGRVSMDRWDERVVKDFEERAWYIRHGLSRADVLDASDAKRHADVEYDFEQDVKERAYPLYRSFQRLQLGSNPRAFISRGLA